VRGTRRELGREGGKTGEDEQQVHPLLIMVHGIERREEGRE